MATFNPLRLFLSHPTFPSQALKTSAGHSTLNSSKDLFKDTAKFSSGESSVSPANQDLMRFGGPYGRSLGRKAQNKVVRTTSGGDVENGRSIKEKAIWDKVQK